MRHAKILHACTCELSQQGWGFTLLYFSVFLTNPLLEVPGVSYQPITGGARCFLPTHYWRCPVFLTNPLLEVPGVSY